MLPTAMLDAARVLIVGPHLSGKRQLFHSLLGRWATRPIVTATRRDADRVRSEHDRVRSEHDGVADADEVVVIDCVSSLHERDPVETPRTKHAAAPGNLTDIGTTFTSVLDARSEQAIAVGVTSLSPLLMYSSAEDVYRFTRLVVQQATSEDAPVVATLKSDVHDDRVEHMIREPFEVTVETRVGEDGNEFRARSREGVTGWRPIDPS